MEHELLKFDGKDGPDIAPMVQRLEEVWCLRQAANRWPCSLPAPARIARTRPS